jgi:hypothetical protein
LRLFLLLTLLLFYAGDLAGQNPAGPDPRLDPALGVGLQRVLDEAAQDGIPTDPLVLKALEGASKGATPARIVDVVDGLGRRMRSVRAAVGARPPDDALVAGAAALLAGAEPAHLRRLAREVEGSSIAARFGALAYLLERGVRPADSMEILGSLVSTGVRSADFIALQRLVEQDLRGGENPTQSARKRARELSLPSTVPLR